MINEYDHVRIVESGITGIVVDKFQTDGRTLYTVESDDRGVPGGFGEDGWWKLFTCKGEDLEKV